MLERPLSRVHVTFVAHLRDSADVVDRRADAARQQLRAEQERQRTLEVEWKSAADKYPERHPDLLRLQGRLEESRSRVAKLHQQVEELGRGPFTGPHPAAIIDTTFTMRVGETVVVGTSRVDGAQALIALLTAVSPPQRK